MTAFDKRRQVFRDLHREGCFALPNPWDVGTARYLRHLGFAAIATTSAGYAFSRGVADGSVGRDEMLAHIKELVEATDLPVNADFENGYADDPDDVAANVRLCLTTGVAGISIEDAGDRRENSIYEVPLAVERLQAAREAIGDSGVLLVGRAEGFWVGREGFDQVLNRLRAYAAAGADCLYAPGLREPDHIRAIVEAVAPKPVNLLLSGPAGLTGSVDFTMADAAALGVRRVSVGGALARAAWGGFIRAATELATHGRFDGFAGAAPHAQLQKLFASTGD
ncbi:MAG TPA: isocitrate lyase/phosphoenolpyruvate mutase family protein [Polyangiaceae bacterium]|nr:isocitrate lyase/phosphoenolpyruvate mutase family protein [Polyangiaceae bacterium]